MGVQYGRVLEMSARTRALEARLGRRCVEGGDPRSGWGFCSISLVIGYGTAWRSVKGSRHAIVEGKLGGRAAVTVFVVSDAQAMRGA